MRRLITLLGSGMLLVGPSAIAQPADPNELKAAITFNIIRYVEFPGKPATQPIQLCVLADADGARQIAALRGQRAGSRTIAVRQIDGSGTNGCDAVYLGQADAGQIARLRQRGTLSLGDGRAFVSGGGMVGLVRTGNQVRFEVNIRSAREAGVVISSKLLRLAARIEQ